MTDASLQRLLKLGVARNRQLIEIHNNNLLKSKNFPGYQPGYAESMSVDMPEVSEVQTGPRPQGKLRPYNP